MLYGIISIIFRRYHPD